MATEQFASHRLDQQSVDQGLQDLRCRIESLDFAHVEAQLGFTLAETMAFYEAELAQRYPISFRDGREFVLRLAEQMVHSDVGAFLLTAQGCDWRTTDLFFDAAHRAAVQQQLQQGRLPLFDYLLFYVFPAWRATHERFGIFQAQTQPFVRDYAVFASLPCGRMRDLLTLDFAQVRNRMHVIGIDKDPAALGGAKALGEQTIRAGVPVLLEFRLGDALRTGVTEPALVDAMDLLTSNGLNIYLTDEQCAAFYTNVYQALKPGGVFITSHLAPPNELCWDRINRRQLQFQAVIWKILINPLWEFFLKPRQSVVDQLERAGFRKVKVIADSQGIFPTFLAIKP